MANNNNLAFLVIAIAVVVAALAVSAIEASPLLSKKDFISLGSLQQSSSSGKAGGGGGSMQQIEYYASVHEASWLEAMDDCTIVFHPNATLLYIETEEEFVIVTNYMNTNADGGEYWVGGQYNTTSRQYQWHNRVPFGPWTDDHWRPGFPGLGTAQTRVQLRHVPLEDPQFMTRGGTEDARFICEVLEDPTEIPDPCFEDNDLVIAVDSSSSVGNASFQVSLEFTARLAAAWAAHAGNRLSVIIYSTEVSFSIRLADSVSLSLAQIREKIYGSYYQAGGTNSHLALDATVAEFASSPRPLVPKNLVFLTDGQSNDPAATLAAAQRVQAAGIRSFPVGITDTVNEAELLVIAGGNKDHVFRTDGFDNLLKLLQPVSRRVCPEN